MTRLGRSCAGIADDDNVFRETLVTRKRHRETCYATVIKLPLSMALGFRRVKHLAVDAFRFLITRRPSSFVSEVACAGHPAEY